MKTYIIMGESSRGQLCVNCSVGQIDSFLKKCGFACSECRTYQEVDFMDMNDVDDVVTPEGKVFTEAFSLKE